MASVIVLCPNGRRCTVKVSPNTVLLQVLEQACAKQKLEPKLYILKHRNSVLDLSTPFRYSNLPNHVNLELVRTEKTRTEDTKVVVAVQCEDGSRVQGEFYPGTVLWEVLTGVGVVGGVASREEEREPLVMYMGHKIHGELSLRSHSLRDLGLTSGKAVLRLLFGPAGSRPTQGNREHTPPTAPSATVDVPQSLTQHGTEPATEQGTEPATEQRTTCSSGSGAQTSTKESTSGQPSNSLPAAALDLETVSPKATPTQQPTEEPMDTAASADGLPYFPTRPFSIFPPETEAELPNVRPGQPETQQPLVVEAPSLVNWTEGILHLLEPFRFPQLPAGVDNEQPRSKVKPVHQPKVYAEPCDREMVVYQLDSSLLMTPSQELPDSFFEVTAEDVQKMHKDHKQQIRQLSEGSLMTRAMRQAQQDRKADLYAKTVIRVQFPDQWVLQGCFQPRESLKTLVKFVRDNLADPQLKFYLYTTPPKEVLRSGKTTFAEAGFLPAAIVHLGTESLQRPLLSEECLSHAQSALHAEVVQAGARERQSSVMKPGTTAMKPAARGTTGALAPKERKTESQPEPPKGATASTSTAKVPKWFKPGK